MSRITDSAATEPCAPRLPGVCRPEPGNVVWAHYNRLAGGKAKGKKLARADHLGFAACYWCHMVIDGQHPRPAHLSLDTVEREIARSLRESEVRLKQLGLWPSAEALATKPVTAQRIVKKVVALEDRQKEKSRAPVRAGRGWPSKTVGYSNVGTQSKTAGKSTSQGQTTSKRIVSGPTNKENARSRFPKGRKLVSANRLQSRPFGAK